MANQKAKPVSRPTTTAKTVKEAAPAIKEKMPFERMNYILLIVGIVIIALGFILMRGPFVDSKTFSVPLHVAPILVIGGFIEIVFAIMYKPKQQAKAE